MRKILLASGSPRRADLLRQIGIDFKIEPSDIDESNLENLSAKDLVVDLSRRKAFDILEKNSLFVQNEKPIIIGADTVVFKDNILGKPSDRDDAYNMLKNLSGGWHEVITGISLVDTVDNNCISDFVVTKVKMKKLSGDEINSYIATNEPMDKAGAYGIQGYGAVFIERIDGCYFNVVGLPISRTVEMFAEYGFKIF